MLPIRARALPKSGEEDAEEGDDAKAPLKRLAATKAEAEAQKKEKPAAADTDDGAKTLRPLQHWLLTRPDGQTAADRHAEWRQKDAAFNTQFARDTKAERGL